MAASSAHDAAVYIGGTATSFSAEAASDVNGDQTLYRVTDATKRAIAPEYAFVVYEDGVQTTRDFVVNFADGSVAFDAGDKPSSTAVVTFDGYYIPLLHVGEAHAFDLEFGYYSFECSKFGDTGRRYTPDRAVFSGSLDHWHQLSEDIDSGAGTRTFAGVLDDATAFIDIRLGGGSERARGWVRMSKAGVACALDQAVNHSVEFEGVRRVAALGRTEQALFTITDW